MPMMKSHVTQLLATTAGHMIHFEADAPTYIPDMAVKEALARGIVHTDDDAPSVKEQLAPVVAPKETSDNVVDTEAEFAAALNNALLRILTRNDPSDLKPDLTPKVNKVVTEMSPDVRRPTATEVSEAYQKLQENIDLSE